jgi:hypothetical protein
LQINRPAVLRFAKSRMEVTLRVIRTFILRLLIEADEAQQLRGTVCPVGDEQEYAFRDTQSLLHLLHQLVQHPQTNGREANSKSGDLTASTSGGRR